MQVYAIEKTLTADIDECQPGGIRSCLHLQNAQHCGSAYIVFNPGQFKRLGVICINLLQQFFPAFQPGLPGNGVLDFLKRVQHGLAVQCHGRLLVRSG